MNCGVLYKPYLLRGGKGAGGEVKALFPVSFWKRNLVNHTAFLATTLISITVFKGATEKKSPVPLYVCSQKAFVYNIVVGSTGSDLVLPLNTGMIQGRTI